MPVRLTAVLAALAVAACSDSHGSPVDAGAVDAPTIDARPSTTTRPCEARGGRCDPTGTCGTFEVRGDPFRRESDCPPGGAAGFYNCCEPMSCTDRGGACAPAGTACAAGWHLELDASRGRVAACPDTSPGCCVPDDAGARSCEGGIDCGPLQNCESFVCMPRPTDCGPTSSEPDASTGRVCGLVGIYASGCFARAAGDVPYRPCPACALSSACALGSQCVPDTMDPAMACAGTWHCEECPPSPTIAICGCDGRTSTVSDACPREPYAALGACAP